jgi:hypothetical protein
MKKEEQIKITYIYIKVKGETAKLILRDEKGKEYSLFSECMGDDLPLIIQEELNEQNKTI